MFNGKQAISYHLCEHSQEMLEKTVHHFSRWHFLLLAIISFLLVDEQDVSFLLAQINLALFSILPQPFPYNAKGVEECAHITSSGKFS